MTMAKRLCLFAAVLVHGLVLADEPAPEAKSLATVEAILQYCARADPAAADQYRDQARLLTQGLSEEMLAKVRKSGEYRQSHESALESLAKAGEQDAKQACAQSVPRDQ